MHDLLECYDFIWHAAIYPIVCGVVESCLSVYNYRAIVLSCLPFLKARNAERLPIKSTGSGFHGRFLARLTGKAGQTMRFFG